MPTGHRLSWPGGEATFYRRYEAVTFSWVVGAEPATIVGATGTSMVSRCLTWGSGPKPS